MGHVRRKPKLLPHKFVVIREHLGIAPVDMARKLEVVRKLKVTSRRLSNYENGKSEPTLMELLAYARLAGVPMDLIVDDRVSVNALRKLLGKSIRGTGRQT